MSGDVTIISLKYPQSYHSALLLAVFQPSVSVPPVEIYDLWVRDMLVFSSPNVTEYL